MQTNIPALDGLWKMEHEKFDMEKVATFRLTESEDALKVAEHLMEKAEGADLLEQHAGYCCLNSN